MTREVDAVGEEEATEIVMAESRDRAMLAL